MTRCHACDTPTPRTVQCGGDNCELRIGSCCLSFDGLCPACVEEANHRNTVGLTPDAMALAEILLSGVRLLGRGERWA